jgi:hypothetical protein
VQLPTLNLAKHWQETAVVLHKAGQSNLADGKRPRKGGKFAPKDTYDAGGKNEIHIDDIRGVSAGKGGLHVEHGDGSKRVIAPEEAGSFLAWHGKHADANERAARLTKPDGATHLSLSDSIKAIDSNRQQWLMRACVDVDMYTGMKSKSMSAIGIWKDPHVGVDTENASFSAIARVPDVETLKYNAALKGLAANQKAVLNVTLNPKGVDTFYHISIPHDTSDVAWKSNIQQIQGVMDKEGVESATLARTPNGTDVMILEQGSANLLDAVKRIAMYFGATSESTKATGEFVGEYKPELDDAAQREASAQEYQSIIYKYEKARGVHYEFKELPPENQPQNKPVPPQFQTQKVGKSLGGLASLRIICLTRNTSGGNIAAEGK